MITPNNADNFLFITFFTGDKDVGQAPRGFTVDRSNINNLIVNEIDGRSRFLTDALSI